MNNDEIPTLQQVAEIAAREHGSFDKPASGRALAELARNMGHRISHTTMNDLLHGRYTAKGDEVLAALAAISSIPESIVRDIAQVPPRLGPFVLPIEAETLDDSQRQVILDTIRLFAIQNRTIVQLGELSRRVHPFPEISPITDQDVDDYGYMTQAARTVRDEPRAHDDQDDGSMEGL